MCHSSRQTAGLLLSAVLLLSTWPLNAEGRRSTDPGSALTEAQTLMELGLFRSAAGLLRRNLDTLGAASSSSPAYHNMELSLAEVYYRSGHYDEALGLGRSCQAYLHDRMHHDASDEIRLESVRVAQLLARTYMARTPGGGNRTGDFDAKSASDLEAADRLLTDAAALARQMSNPLPLLEVLALRAELGGRTGDQAEESVARWQEVDRQAQTIAIQFEKRQLPLETYAIAAGILARSYVAQRRSTEALQLLSDLLERLDPHDDKRSEIGTQVAAIQRRAGAYRAEAEAWQGLLRLHTERYERTPPRTALEGISRLTTEADYHYYLARALHDAQSKAAAKELETSFALYSDALQRLSHSQMAKEDANKVMVRREAALEGLLMASRRMHDYRTENRSKTPDHTLAAAVQLHRLLRESRLSGDPRLCQLEVDLGAWQVERRRFDDARGYLENAVDSYRKYAPTNRVSLARALNLLSEVERMHGALEKAQEHLTEAAELLDGSDRSTENLRLTVRVNQGRLAAAVGRYADADRCFQYVIAEARQTAPPANESLGFALLNKGLLYRSLLKLDAAERDCREALAVRRAAVPDLDPELLPYYLGLAGIQVERCNLAQSEAGILAELQKTLRAARNIYDQQNLDPDPRDADERLLEHLEATVAFLKYQAGRDLRDADAARARWELLRAKQHRSGPRVEEALTCYYLSRLAFLQWRYNADRQRNERKSLDNRVLAYQQECEKLMSEKQTYDACRDAYDKEVDKYELALKAYDPGRSGQWQYDDLQRRRKELEETQTRLAQSNAKLRMQYDRLTKDYDQVNAGHREYCEQYPPLQEQYVVSRPISGHAVTSVAQLLTEADQLASQSLQFLEEIGGYPNLQYAALCNRAQILRAQAGVDEVLRRKAIDQLAQATALVETPRLSMFGGDVGRSEFFANYAIAFDLLVTWLVEDGRPEEALVYAELRRNRTFLDRTRTDGADLARSLPDTKKHLAQEEQETLAAYAVVAAELADLQEQGAALLTQGQRSRMEELEQQAKGLQKRLKLAGQEVLCNSRLYQNVLGTPLSAKTVRRAIAECSRSPDPMLYYYGGAIKSFVFLVGGARGRIEAFELASAGPQQGARKGVSTSEISIWVQEYVRGLKSLETFSSESDHEHTGLIEITNALVPYPVREAIKSRSPETAHVFIVPDGKLYKLPFEALVVEDGTHSKFLIDEFQPLAFAYAPSIMILDCLRASRDAAGGGAWQTVSLGRPDFSHVTRRAGSVAQPYLDAIGRLADLPQTEDESNGVVRAFDHLPTLQLLQQEATENRLRVALATKNVSFLHLATHGIVLDGDLDTDAALALALPADELMNSEDDGFLQLREVYDLPLNGCQLVVLSACESNVGPARPLEMGAALSRAFLSAGARRVISTQWKVDDKSSARLVARFSQEIAAALNEQGTCDYAVALQRARDNLRRIENKQWDHPFFWAPFVLLGPAN